MLKHNNIPKELLHIDDKIKVSKQTHNFKVGDIIKRTKYDCGMYRVLESGDSPMLYLADWPNRRYNALYLHEGWYPDVQNFRLVTRCEVVWYESQVQGG